MNRDLKGVALAGGGPIGGIYEVGALAALDEALVGLDLTGCDIFVGVSSGAFVAAGLANGITPRDMHRKFIESEEADDPFEPEILLQPAFQEFGRRLASLPGLLALAMQSYLNGAPPHGFAESLQQLGRALPAGMFDNEAVGAYLARLFSAQGRVNDFRRLPNKLFIVATDLDSCSATPFGARGLDDVPISRAVQASSALPGLYPPVEINGRHYVDGALMKTLHASVALAEGAKLLICVNPLTPIDADAVARKTHRSRVSLAARGLPSVMSQTFRALIHSRMRVGMERYSKTYPDADVILFEPARDDAEMFFTNVFSYSSRHRLAEHAYQRTREELRRRADELDVVLARHGVSLDRACLADESRTLSRRRRAPRRAGLKQAASQLGNALDTLERALR
ncbi:putative acylesterase/phospholipase RssA [Rhodoblastus acidophilus]|uniref:patatin-like phospholipase family protein n=1 Tax=Rhodoblastus acidophilus TaxID=1074 RepID=UPI0022255173|nr:patatin-like phospholipase family protein [Rhodoblastus acidophilus]MCW2273140.1 putative acylesterase/phospholipase RssA [Rhodoblastus acidophilus]